MQLIEYYPLIVGCVYQPVIQCRRTCCVMPYMTTKRTRHMGTSTLNITINSIREAFGLPLINQSVVMNESFKGNVLTTSHGGWLDDGYCLKSTTCTYCTLAQPIAPVLPLSPRLACPRDGTRHPCCSCSLSACCCSSRLPAGTAHWSSTCRP